MNNRYRLVGVKNAELLAELSLLVERSNELTGDLLAHLAELDAQLPRFSSSITLCPGRCLATLWLTTSGFAVERTTSCTLGIALALGTLRRRSLIGAWSSVEPQKSAASQSRQTSA